MKTTVEIDEDLIARTREVARREGTTLRALIEEGLRAALAQREQKAAAPYHWPDLSVDGEGLAPDEVRRRGLAQALQQGGQCLLRGDLSELQRLREEG